MHRKGKPYHLFSQIFLPSFAHITLITHAGLIGPCVIGIKATSSMVKRRENFGKTAEWTRRQNKI
jgi:hypothetical protein